MSSIDSLSSTATSAASGADVTQLSGSKDEFLKLFMAQLEHQDPLSPKDGSDMVAQLAQFSQVEQATQTNQQLSALTASQSSSANASLSSLVGRECSASVGDVQIEDPTAIPPINVSSGGTITGGSIVIKDSDGKTIQTLAIPANGGAIKWDGKDASGKLVAPGSYNISVNSGTTATTITANWQDKIDSVELGVGGSRLKMGGISISPSTITEIGATSAATTTDSITTAINAASTSAGASNS